MKTMIKQGLSCLLLISATSGFAADIYQWVDEAGNVHFSDKPTAAEATKIEIEAIQTYTSPQVDTLEAGVDAANQTQIVIFSTAWCSVCKQAKAYMQEKGLAYQEYDIEKSEQNRRMFAKLDGKGVPIILVGKRRMQGFNPLLFEAMLAHLN